KTSVEVGPCHPEPILYVFECLGTAHRGKELVHIYPLEKLAHFSSVQLVAEFILADQKYLQELVFRHFNIGEEPDVLEAAYRKEMGLIYDQHNLPAIKTRLCECGFYIVG